VRALLQDSLRWWIGWSLTLLGVLLAIGHRRRIHRFDRDQQALRRRYGIEASTPIHGWGPEQEASIAAYARSHPQVTMAKTSGSTATPKAIAYPPARVRHVKWAFIDAFARAYADRPPKRKSLYVFSSLHEDSSLTGMMLEEKKLPPYLSGLQAPYRVQSHRALRALATEYGDAALRTIVLAFANPGVLYATNPSTLAQFLDALAAPDRARDLVRALPSLGPEARRVFRRIESIGARTRLARIAASTGPLTLADVAPSVEAFISWDGGYVAPFLARIARAAPGLRHLPMYSMSTETIETVPDYRGGDVAFLPLAPGVLYELLPEDAGDDPAQVRTARQLAIGERYTLVVSDAYGLVRYQTADVFEVRRMIDGLPDLRFVRRRGLAYSFTGEKLTAEQVSLASERLREARPELAGWFLSIMPCLEGEPHYVLFGVGAGALDLAALAEAFDRSLAEINDEYGSKRKSGRLGPMRAKIYSLERFATEIASVTPRSDWESQLKLLPLYPRLFVD
jgi:hypothetical protein